MDGNEVIIDIVCIVFGLGLVWCLTKIFDWAFEIKECSTTKVVKEYKEMTVTKKTIHEEYISPMSCDSIMQRVHNSNHMERWYPFPEYKLDSIELPQMERMLSTHIRNHNCENCGGTVINHKCEYCNTQY